MESHRKVRFQIILFSNCSQVIQHAKQNQHLFLLKHCVSRVFQGNEHGLVFALCRFFLCCHMQSFVPGSRWQLCPFQVAGGVLCSPVGLLVVLSVSHLCLADSASIQRHSLPGKSFPVSFPRFLERKQGSIWGHTNARYDAEHFTALCLNIPSCKMGNISPSPNFGGVQFVTVYKGRSCCRNGIFLSVQLVTLRIITALNWVFLHTCWGFFFVPHSYGNLISPSAKHLQAL